MKNRRSVLLTLGSNTLSILFYRNININIYNAGKEVPPFVTRTPKHDGIRKFIQTLADSFSTRSIKYSLIFRVYRALRAVRIGLLKSRSIYMYTTAKAALRTKYPKARYLEKNGQTFILLSRTARTNTKLSRKSVYVYKRAV